jgi:hypothetical protein
LPYSARAGVRKQIEQIVEDGILELSGSSFINTLTILYRENKEPRTCIDVSRVNNVMSPDWTRAQPIDEMLQQFHGVMTSLDMASAVFTDSFGSKFKERKLRHTAYRQFLRTTVIFVVVKKSVTLI